MLLAPPAELKQPLAKVSVEPALLVRVSAYAEGEPYFGREAANRFDDPRSPKASRFGTCYLGFALDVAIAETVLHDEVAQDGGFLVGASEIERRNVVTLAGSLLTLADCTGASLLKLGLDGRFSTAMDYTWTRRWSVALHEHPDHVDGFLYISRNMNTGRAIVLFERAAVKLIGFRTNYQPLATFPGTAEALKQLGVRLR